MKLPEGFKLPACVDDASIEAIVRHCANRCFTLADVLKESCESSYTSDDYTARGIGEELLNDFGLKKEE
jgi:hypothetical protein